MGRIRTIKPEFFSSEDITSLTPLARILYMAIWCEADREGRLTWKPMTFKLRYLPGDACDVHALCQELVDRRLVVLYGPGLAHIPTFRRHQHINPRESASCLPSPDQCKEVLDSVLSSPSLDQKIFSREVNASTLVAGASSRVTDTHIPITDTQVGKERKGKEVATSVDGFEEFWAAWPQSERKGSKGKCLEVWKKQKLSLHTSKVLDHLERMKRTEGWTAQSGKFIPAPLTYLNRQSWEGAELSVNTCKEIYV